MSESKKKEKSDELVKEIETALDEARTMIKQLEKENLELLVQIEKWRKSEARLLRIKANRFGIHEEETEKASTCTHTWEECKGLVFDYIAVSNRCAKCGMYRR